MPSIAIGTTNALSTNIHTVFQDPNKAFNGIFHEYFEFYPSQHSTSAPEHCPSEVSRVFIQAREAHKRADMDLAAMGYRRALELALKAIDPNLKGQLGPRIDQLASRHVLTPAMKEWADDTRILGNEANHDAPEPTPENVEQLHLFVESLLEYLFTLPERVKLRRAAAQPPAGGQT